MRNITECFTYKPRVKFMDIIRAENMSAKMSVVRQGKSPTDEAVMARADEMYPPPFKASTEPTRKPRTPKA